MEDNYLQIASRIRELREACDYTEKQLAEELGISLETYLEYEKSGKNIPISTLYDIANKFGVDFTEILTGYSPHLDSCCVVRKGEGINVDRYEGYKFESIAYKFKNRIMEPMIVDVDYHENGEHAALVSHGGQEMNYVLSGSIAVIYENREVVLHEGDCIYFDPTVPHGQKAVGGKSARFLTIICEG